MLGNLEYAIVQVRDKDGKLPAEEQLWCFATATSRGAVDKATQVKTTEKIKSRPFALTLLSNPSLG